MVILRYSGNPEVLIPIEAPAVQPADFVEEGAEFFVRRRLRQLESQDVFVAAEAPAVTIPSGWEAAKLETRRRKLLRIITQIPASAENIAVAGGPSHSYVVRIPKKPRPKPTHEDTTFVAAAVAAVQIAWGWDTVLPQRGKLRNRLVEEQLFSVQVVAPFGWYEERRSAQRPVVARCEDAFPLFVQAQVVVQVPFGWYVEQASAAKKLTKRREDAFLLFVQAQVVVAQPYGWESWDRNVVARRVPHAVDEQAPFDIARELAFGWYDYGKQVTQTRRHLQFEHEEWPSPPVIPVELFAGWEEWDMLVVKKTVIVPITYESFGGGTGGSPAIPTLSVNAAGTVATVTGSSVGSLNTIEVIPAFTGIGVFTWTFEGSRIGDGDVPLGLAPGFYWGRDISTAGGGSSMSNLVYFRVGQPDSTLGHSPADILRRLLIALGYGADPPSTPWPIFAAGEPNAPDEVVTCYDTSDRGDGRIMNDGERGEHRGVQIRIRSSTHNSGYIKARAIAVAIDEEIYQNTVDMGGGSVYLVHCVNRSSDVIALGVESPDSKRKLFTINVLMSLRQLT